MPDLNQTITTTLAAYYEFLAQKLHKWADPIPEKDFWHNPYLYGNDIGHLVLHLAGNLNYYIGAEIAKTGYIRDRDKEFTDKTPPTKSQALAKFDQAIAMVVATIRKQSSDDWSAPYSGEGVDANTRFAILLDCASHADHHIGQILNLARELTHQQRIQ